jgi:hypothetical protein
VASDAAPQWFAYLLTGDDTAAKSVAGVECQRIAEELNQPRSTTSDQPQGRFFTVDFFQGGGLPLPHDPQLLNFPLDASALAAKMKIELEDIYAIHGREGFDDLADSIRESTRIHLLNVNAKSPISFANATTFASDDEVIEAAIQVSKAYRAALDELLKRVVQSEKEIQRTAVALARERLGDAAKEIINEAARYIESMSGLQSSAVGASLQSNIPSGQIILNASGVAPLIGALRKIAKRVVALQAASSALANKVGAVKEQFLASEQWVQGFPATFDQSPEAIKEMFPSESGKVEDTARALEIEVSVQCRTFPVLYRIWKDNEIPDSVTFVPSPTGEAKVRGTDAAGSLAVGKLTRSLRNTLFESYAANLSFAQDIDDDPAIVWRYPPLIDAALSKLQHNDPSVEFQAAQERLASEAGPDLATELSMAAGAIDGAAMLLAANPEVLLVLAVITLVADAISSVVDFRKNLQSERAFHSVLDPSKAPAADPSYVGVIINLVGTLLDVKGFADAVRTAKFAKRASAAQTAVNVIAQ